MKQEKCRFTFIVAGALMAINAQAEVIPDSVDTYNNQTVATEVTVQGRTVLSSQNVVVTSTGNLTLNSPEGVNLPQSYEVALGGTLVINGGLQSEITFVYDASGNRIRREPNY